MTTVAMAPQDIPARRKVLLVEDSPLVAMSLETLFEDMDWEMQGPATRLEEALALAETTDADIALLDVNLDGEMSWAVADVLKARGVPFVFATGYDGASMLPEAHSDARLVSKPFQITELEDLLREMVGEEL
ncbi:response regulator [Sphingosinicella microcystinivorans]|uniref:Response regulator n=1 Tax=Sphingosinicella microcystinivorans TaxID=335406 RepID=A0AAD1D8B2_SPHMI|nr:response regulator [Sphingosinicella microcystinivorans]RKS87972.1 response regulator receiver domain-containing protein [Sphingosinicella microcystinivorans]BBE35783.1 response regulator [Sphingosinicella microcystinivorans]